MSLVVLGLVALFHALSIGAQILVPLLFALLLAMLLNPVTGWLHRHGIPRILAIALSVLLAMVLLVGLGYFVTTQAADLAGSLPAMEDNFDDLYKDARRWAQRSFGMARRDVDQALEKVKEQGMDNGGSLVGRTITTVGTLFTFLFLLPVFTFMLLLYKRILLGFIRRLFPPRDQTIVEDVLCQTRVVVQSYLIGLLMQACIVAGLNWAGLLCIGVPYAFVLAVLGALLNLVPYVGMMVATILTMLVAMTGSGPQAALWVLLLFMGVQFIDNNLITPRVVGKRVELNALASIIAVMVGGALWGVPGMFLALPVTAILKVVFDRVPALRPFGYLLGDDVEPAQKLAPACAADPPRS
ncbi:MAG: AI-2E family transporter [Flavobacteriales bacterium]|nr:AI-2E family transporter [Flavobacteriales bacterium]